ncbi:MAG: prefoldin subunit alpha [Nanoarchaeota archaeon]|nr:prefoldin subunit alpha [Nanoarchaeota archaeon]
MKLTQSPERQQTPERQQEIQEKYAHLKMIVNQAAQLQEQQRFIDTRVFELEDLNNNLDSLKKWEKGKEILAPLGANTFIRAELKDNKGVIVDMGAKVMLDKDIEGAKQFNNSQFTELRDASIAIRGEILKLSSQQEKISEELRRLVAKRETH